MKDDALKWICERSASISDHPDVFSCTWIAKGIHESVYKVRKYMKELEAVQGKFISFQDEYSLACRKNEQDMLELPDKLKLTPLTWGSLGQGILTGKNDQNATFGTDDRRSREIYTNFHGDTLRQNLKIVEAMRGIAGEVNKPLSAVAIRWILDYIPESVVIVGIKNVSQLLSNAEAMGWKLDDQYIQHLEVVSRKAV